MFITYNSLIVRLAGVGSGGEEKAGHIVASQTLNNVHKTNSQIRDTLHCQSQTKMKVVKWC